jgi:hypothetical protein
VELVYPRSEVLTIPPECYLQTAQKLVHTQQQRGRGIGTSSERRGAFKHNYTVSQVGGHYEIVFYNKRCFLCMQNEPFDNLGSHQTLLRVQIGGRLINQVDICRLWQELELERGESLK